MKKILLCTTVLAGFATSAFAAEVTNVAESMQVSIGGTSKFEGGYIKRNRDYKNRFTFSPNQSSTAFLTSNKVAVRAQGTSDDVTYGAVVRLQTTADMSNGMSDSGMDRSHLFVNTNAGAIQLGTNFSASKLLAVDAGTIASATGGVAGGDAWSFVDLIPNTVANSMVVTDTDQLSDRIDSGSESYRKITYLSPEVSGVQLGLSFAPDAENNGAENYTVENSSRYLGGPVSVKNVWSGALKLKHTMNDISFQLSLTGNMGKADKRPYYPQGKAYNQYDVNPNTGNYTGVAKQVYLSEYTPNASNINRNDLRTYAVGGVVEYQGFSAAVSYNNDGKSMAPKSSQFRSSWWTAGLAYKNGPMSTSLTYLNGRKGNKNYQDNDNTYPSVKTNAVSLGADYAVVPGLTPFAEVTLIQVKPKRVINGNTKQKATVFILGAKAKF